MVRVRHRNSRRVEIWVYLWGKKYEVSLGTLTMGTEVWNRLKDILGEHPDEIVIIDEKRDLLSLEARLAVDDH